MLGRAWSYGAVRGPSVLLPPRSMPTVTPGPNSQTPLCAQRSALRRLKTLRRIPPSRVCDKRTALNPSPLRLFSGVTIPSPYPNELPLGILQLSPRPPAGYPRP